MTAPPKIVTGTCAMCPNPLVRKGTRGPAMKFCSAKCANDHHGPRSRARLRDPKLFPRLCADCNEPIGPRVRKCPGCQPAVGVGRTLGVTQREYDEMLKSQRGLCAICRRPSSSFGKLGGVRSLSIDHNHATNLKRELLCHNCNVGIGLFDDDPERLAAAAEYLRRHMT